MAIPTVNEANGDFTHYAVIDHTDLQKSGFLSTIGAANQVKIATIPAGGGVVYAVAFEAEALRLLVFLFLVLICILLL